MKNKVHFLYIVGILLVIIIFLVTYKFGNNDKLIDYLKFGLTITSLFLALIAIIYSFISNATISSNLGTINNAANDISKVSSSLEKTNQNLMKEMSIIPTLIKGVEEKIDESKELIKSIESPKTIRGKGSKVTVDFTEENIKNMLNTLSFSGLITLYITKLSFELKKPIDLKILVENEYLTTIDYSHAIIITFYSFGLLDYTELNKIYSVTDLNKFIFENIEDEITDLAKKYDKKNEKRIKEYPEFSWTKAIKLVEDYFELNK